MADPSSPPSDTNSRQEVVEIQQEVADGDQSARYRFDAISNAVNNNNVILDNIAGTAIVLTFGDDNNTQLPGDLNYERRLPLRLDRMGDQHQLVIFNLSQNNELVADVLQIAHMAHGALPAPPSFPDRSKSSLPGSSGRSSSPDLPISPDRPTSFNRLTSPGALTPPNPFTFPPGQMNGHLSGIPPSNSDDSSDGTTSSLSADRDQQGSLLPPFTL